MTYNVFGGTLNLAHSFIHSLFLQALITHYHLHHHHQNAMIRPTATRNTRLVSMIIADTENATKQMLVHVAAVGTTLRRRITHMHTAMITYSSACPYDR